MIIIIIIISWFEIRGTNANRAFVFLLTPAFRRIRHATATNRRIQRSPVFEEIYFTVNLSPNPLHAWSNWRSMEKGANICVIIENIYIFKSLEIVFQNSIVFMFIWFFSRKISSKFKLISSRLCIYIYIVTWDKWQKKKLILLLYLWPCSTNRKTIVKNKSEEIIT